MMRFSVNIQYFDIQHTPKPPWIVVCYPHPRCLDCHCLTHHTYGLLSSYLTCTFLHLVAFDLHKLFSASSRTPVYIVIISSCVRVPTNVCMCVCVCVCVYICHSALHWHKLSSASARSTSLVPHLYNVSHSYFGPTLSLSPATPVSLHQSMYCSNHVNKGENYLNHLHQRWLSSKTLGNWSF